MEKSGNFKHGGASRIDGKLSPTYIAWKSMRQRCNSDAGKNYARYKGRGITYCERWEDYSLFLLDMGERPTSGHSLDRIDNGGNYQPDNCRWATVSEQVKNRDNVIRYEWDGILYTAKELAVAISVPYDVLYQRIRRYKWPKQRWQEPTRVWPT